MCPSVYWYVRSFVDNVDAETITAFHEYVEVGVRRCNLHPTRMIVRQRSFHGSYKSKLT